MAVNLAHNLHAMQLNNKRLWQSLINFLLLNYHEMELVHSVELLYYVFKMGYRNLQIDLSFFDEKTQRKF